MLNDWYIKFYPQHGTGARDKFQDVCYEILSEKNPRSIFNIIRVDQGDQGIDILSQNSETKETTIFQCKFFDQAKLGESQKSQIRESFQRAYTANKDTFHKWSLCIPLDLSKPELNWWEKWKKEKEEETNIIIELFDGHKLIEISKEVDSYNRIFNEEYKEQISELYNHVVRKNKSSFIIPDNKKSDQEESLIGILLDGSEEMLAAISKSEIENPEDFGERILDFLKMYKYLLTTGSQEYLSKFNVFLLGYSKKSKLQADTLFAITKKAIKNHTVDLFGHSADNNHCITDLLTMNGSYDSFKNRFFKSLSLSMMFSGGPYLAGGLKTFQEYIELNRNYNNKILIIITTGKITKDSENEIDLLINEIKGMGISIIVIYFNRNMLEFKESFTLHDAAQTQWSESAQRAFNLSSKINSNHQIHDKVKSLAEVNNLATNENTKLFFPLIPDKTFTFLKLILLGDMDD